MFRDEIPNSLIQPVQCEGKHRENLSDRLDGPDVLPFFLGTGVKPQGMTEGIGEEVKVFDAGCAGSRTEADSASAGDQFMVTHAGIAHQDDPGFRISGGEVENRFRLVPPLSLLRNNGSVAYVRKWQAPIEAGRRKRAPPTAEHYSP